MGTPIFYIKSDAAGEMFEVTDARRFIRGGEGFEYSDESKAARAEWEKARAKLPAAPTRPAWPGRGPDPLPEKHTKKAAAEHRRAVKEHEAAVSRYNAEWKAYLAAEEAWRRDVIAPAQDRIRARWRKKWVERMAGMQPGLVRIEVGPGGPVMARNLVKRLRLVRPVDAKALDRLDRQIARLQVERANLILGAWERGEATTPEHVVAVADAPEKARTRLTAPVTQSDLNGIHMVTKYAVEKRGEKGAA